MERMERQARAAESKDPEFHKLIDCSAYVSLWISHPPANAQTICLELLADDPRHTEELYREEIKRHSGRQEKNASDIGSAYILLYLYDIGLFRIF